MSAAESIIQNQELRKRVFFTLIMVAIYRVGVAIPIPGVDGTAVMQFFQSQGGGLFSLFNTFSGGALSRFSVFALGIMPYISSSIIMQLLTTVFPALEAMRKEGQAGQRKINQYTRYLTVGLGLIQGYSILTFLKHSQTPSGLPVVQSLAVGAVPFEIMTLATLLAGTCFIMWMGEQITERGIGNGSSIIIYAGIAADVPKGAVNLWNLVSKGEMSGLLGLLLLAFMVLVIGLIIILEVGQRRIPIQYSQRGPGRQAMNTPSSHLPLKINFAGVIPAIFASSLLMFPATVAQITNNQFLGSIRDKLTPSGSIYNILYVALIVFFCFFYTQVVFNPNDVAENLKKYSGFIPGIRAGKSTADYIQKVLERINVGGAIYLSALCVLPGILIDFGKVPFHFGGTSLLILVGVALDTAQQIQSYVITQKYESFLKGGGKIRSRRVTY